MTMYTWSQLDGPYCTINDGIMIPEFKVLKTVLDAIAEALLSTQEFLGRVDVWLPIPGGINICLVDTYGKLTDFSNFVPDVEIWGLQWFGKTFVIPKRSFVNTPTMLLSTMFDKYWEIDNPLFKKVDDDGQEITCAYGVIADTGEVVAWAVLLIACVKYFKLSGMLKTAVKLTTRLWRWYKARQLRGRVEEIHEVTVDQMLPMLTEVKEYVDTVLVTKQDIGLKLNL